MAEKPKNPSGRDKADRRAGTHQGPYVNNGKLPRSRNDGVTTFFLRKIGSPALCGRAENGRKKCRDPLLTTSWISEQPKEIRRAAGLFLGLLERYRSTVALGR